MSLSVEKAFTVLLTIINYEVNKLKYEKDNRYLMFVYTEKDIAWAESLGFRRSEDYYAVHDSLWPPEEQEGEVVDFCLKCKRTTFVIESEGISPCGRHYPIGYCKNCNNGKNPSFHTFEQYPILIISQPIPVANTSNLSPKPFGFR